MIYKLLLAFILMTLCVTLHALALTLALRWLSRRLAAGTLSFSRALGLLIVMAIWMVMSHLVQIIAWAFFYDWKNAMPDIASAAYFSAVTYTTVGYGDLVLPPAWRLVGGVEALTGILMCAWSTGVSFSAFNQMLARQSNLRLRPPDEGTE